LESNSKKAGDSTPVLGGSLLGGRQPMMPYIAPKRRKAPSSFLLAQHKRVSSHRLFPGKVDLSQSGTFCSMDSAQPQLKEIGDKPKYTGKPSRKGNVSGSPRIRNYLGSREQSSTGCLCRPYTDLSQGIARKKNLKKRRVPGPGKPPQGYEVH